MVRFQRTRKFLRHKKAEAVRYAKEAADLANLIDKNANFKVFTGRFESIEKTYWIADFDGLAALEITLQKIESDQRWHEFIAKAPGDIYVEGTAEESVIQLEE